MSNGYDTRLQYGREIPLIEPNWISGDPFSGILGAEGDKVEIAFKTRHSPEFYTGHLIKNSDDEIKIISDCDVQGIAPGQFAIVYSPDKVLCLGSAMISNGVKKRRRHHNKNIVSEESKKND